MLFGRGSMTDANTARRRTMKTLALGVSLLLATLAATAGADPPSLPPGFVWENAVTGSSFDTPTALAFLPDGRFFVAEKRGRVYLVTNGVQAATPHWSRELEVLNADDRGLLGLAVDPNYYVNHYVYLMYTVDPDSNGTDTDIGAFGRLTRYQVGFTDSTTFLAS